MIGKNRRVCSAVKATIVPALICGPAPLASVTPATRYTIAGVMPKNACTSAKKPWPVICWRTCSPASRSLARR